MVRVKVCIAGLLLYFSESYSNRPRPRVVRIRYGYVLPIVTFCIGAYRCNYFTESVRFSLIITFTTL